MWIIARYRKSLVELFEDVQRLRRDLTNVALCASIQERLIKRVTHIESRIRSLRRQTQLARSELSMKRTGDNARAESQTLKELIKSKGAEIEQYTNLLYVFKTVGDAIAFTYINRWSLKPLAFRESAGFISGKLGSRFERSVARDAWSKGAPVILNDLTNCIRYGDLALPKEGRFLLLELKTSQNISERGKRQMEALASMRDYLNTDQADGLFGAPGLTIRAPMHAEEVDHCEALNALIARSEGLGYAFDEVESGLFYFVGRDDSGISKFFDFAIGKCRGAPVICTANDGKFAGAGYSPFTLSIADPTAAFDFWAGRLVIVVLIDRQEISDTFARRDRRVEFAFGSERPLRMFTPSVTGEESKISVGSHMFSRLFTEFLSLKWMIDALIHVQSDALENFDVEIGAKPDDDLLREDGDATTPP